MKSDHGDEGSVTEAITHHACACIAVDNKYKSRINGELFGSGRINRGRNHRVHHIVGGLVCDAST
jgi:hypothetical protein